MKIRSSKRKHLIYYLKVNDSNTGEELGTLGDVTHDGIMIFTNKTYTEDEKLSVSINLSDIDEIKLNLIKLKLNVKWIKPDPNQDRNCLGCTIRDASEETTNIIDVLIEFLGLSE